MDSDSWPRTRLASYTRRSTDCSRRKTYPRHGDRAVNDLLLRRVLYGISCRNYAAAAEAIPGAIGLSGSTVSRAFIEASAAKLRELQERDLSREDVVALVLDGKTFAESTMVVALGITMTGEKRFLGFVETAGVNPRTSAPENRSRSISSRYKKMKKGSASIHGIVQNLFRVGRHLLRSAHHRLLRTRAFVEWDAVTCAC